MAYSTWQRSDRFKSDARVERKTTRYGSLITIQTIFAGIISCIFSSGSPHTSEQFYYQSAEYSSLYQYAYRNSSAMARNEMNGIPFNQSEIPSPLPDGLFSSEEKEALIAHRKRYLATAFVNTGFPIDTPSISPQAAGRYGTSVAREESTSFNYQDDAGNMASMSSTVG
jgi:hypothetical protein